VFGQHGWWIEGPSGSPYDAGHPLAANLNQVISTAASDPVSGSIPLRCSWCEVEKIESSDASEVREQSAEDIARATT
jgi:hypothetical protein